MSADKLTSRQVNEARRLRAAGASLSSIASRYGVTGAAIGYHCRDIRPDKSQTVRKPPKIDRGRVLAMFAAGSSLSAIARSVNASTSGVEHALKSMEDK